MRLCITRIHFVLALAPIAMTASSRLDEYNNHNAVTKENDQEESRELHPWAYGSSTNAHRPRPTHQVGYSQYQRSYDQHSSNYNIPCDPYLTPFTAELLVDFNGDPAFVTPRDVQFLEQGFRIVYNLLSKRLCDDKFREIHTVTALADYGESPVIPRGGLSFGLRYLVKGLCRGCAPNSHLFSPPLGYHHRALSMNETKTISLVQNEIHEWQLWQPQLEWDHWQPVPTQKKSYNPDYYGMREHQTRYCTKGSKTKGTKSLKSSKGYFGYKVSKSSPSYDGDYESSCTCNSPHPMWRQPTEAGFGKAFNTYIVKLAHASRLDHDYDNSIEIINDVLEINGVYCAQQQAIFETFLEIDFIGDYNALSPFEINTLENNVLAVYNGLGDKQCDNLFRDVESVSIVFGESVDNVFTLLFLVEAKCRGQECDSDTKIFEDSNRRKLLLQQGHHHEKECFCPVYDREYGAPTSNAFKDSFREAVLELVAIGDLIHVEDVVEVMTEIGDGETQSPVESPVPVGIPAVPPSASPSSQPSVSEDGGAASPTISPSDQPSISTVPSVSPSISPTTSFGPSSSPSDSSTALPRSNRTQAEMPSVSPSLEPSQSVYPSGEPSLSTSPSSQPSVPSEACDQQECFYQLSVNVDSVGDGVIIDTSIAFDAVSFIRNIKVDIATTLGNDLEMILTSPNQDSYILMLNTIATGGATGIDLRMFDLGIVPGNESLSNVAPYTFVEERGRTGFTSPYSSPGVYNAETWGTDGPYRNGNWKLRIVDNGQGDPSSIGRFSMRYCGICPNVDGPSSSPSISLVPSASKAPSESPSISTEPSQSMEPSFSLEPSSSQSPQPSTSSEPSLTPSMEPSISLSPSISEEPSSAPSESWQPSVSAQPSLAPSTSVEPKPPRKKKRPGSHHQVSACNLEECAYPLSIDVDRAEVGTITNTSIPFEAISFIRSVQVEIASTYGEDMEIVLTSPDGDEYILMFDRVAIEGDGGNNDPENFDLGIAAHDPSLSNVGSYVFVETGGLAGFTAPYSQPGTYNADKWGENAPYATGQWNFRIIDNAFGDTCSIGDVIIRYCGTCIESASPSQSPSTPPSVPQGARKQKYGQAKVNKKGKRKRGENLLRHR